MKTSAVVLMAMLVAMSLSVRSNTAVSFSAQVLVEQTFSPDELNLTITSGDISHGDTVLLGKHQDYLRAMKDKYIITGNTSNKAEIVAFFGNEKISLEDAFTLLNNYNIYEKGKDIKFIEQNKTLHYSIEILTTEKQHLYEYIKICPELEKMIAQKDENIFLMGHISSFNKAVALQEKLSAAGLINNVIVAYEGNKQVPVYHLANKK